MGPPVTIRGAGGRVRADGGVAVASSGRPSARPTTQLGHPLHLGGRGYAPLSGECHAVQAPRGQLRAEEGVGDFPQLSLVDEETAQGLADSSF